MKKLNKKGFTIVELVIVIAVIAILAAVMIPTFSNVIESAEKTAIQRKAEQAYKDAYALDMYDGKQDYNVTADKLDLDDGVTFTYTAAEVSYTDGKYMVTYENGTWTVEEVTVADEGGADEGDGEGDEG